MSAPGGTFLAPLTTPLWSAWGMPLSLGDMLGFATGIACVWLAARANVWNFPLGIVNSAILGLVFLERRLFADAGLQVAFIVLGLRGLHQWQSGGHAQENAAVFRSSRRELALLTAAAAVLTALLFVVSRWLGGSAPLADASIAALSLCAQWLLNRRALETWAFWIVIDLISVPLYWLRGLPLIALLYALFIALCVLGLRNWRRLVAPGPSRTTP